MAPRVLGGRPSFCHATSQHGASQHATPRHITAPHNTLTMPEGPMIIQVLRRWMKEPHLHHFTPRRGTSQPTTSQHHTTRLPCRKAQDGDFRDCKPIHERCTPSHYTARHSTPLHHTSYHGTTRLPCLKKQIGFSRMVSHPRHHTTFRCTSWHCTATHHTAQHNILAMPQALRWVFGIASQSPVTAPHCMTHHGTTPHCTHTPQHSTPIHGTPLHGTPFHSTTRLPCSKPRQRMF